jgi:hypothetical protein
MAVTMTVAVAVAAISAGCRTNALNAQIDRGTRHQERDETNQYTGHDRPPRKVNGGGQGRTPEHTTSTGGSFQTADAG